MQIFVRAESTHVLNVEKCDTISSIKSFIEQEEGTASLCQYVTFQGVPLNDDDTFESCSIDEMSNLDICVRLLGGKFSSLRISPYFVLRFFWLPSFYTLFPYWLGTVSPFFRSHMIPPFLSAEIERKG
eukprot:Sdes_comp10997_c0_seq2m2638